jgi:dTDP-4-amino-4,6-dideoxygalactose transaminase
MDLMPTNIIQTPIPLVDLSSQYHQIRVDIDRAIKGVLDSCGFILGPEVADFEREFAAFCDAKYAVGVGNGTDALILALKALGVGPGDEVITVPNTFVATVEAIAHVGAKPVFVDIEPNGYNLDPNRLEAALTQKTRAVIPVHLYGQPADMDPIMEVADRHGLRVLEDAAQAHGAEYKGRRAGSMGDAAGFSFYPGKNLGAYGDGGAVVTNSDGVYETLLQLRNHGSEQHYFHEVIGYNSRLDSMQAAILRVKLAHLDEWNYQRRAHAALYSDLLAGVPGVKTPSLIAGTDSVFHLYVIQLLEASREDLKVYMAENGISTGVHYPIPVHLVPAFRFLGYREGDFPLVEQAMKRIISLPMYPELSQAQIEFIADRVYNFVGSGS